MPRPLCARSSEVSTCVNMSKIRVNCSPAMPTPLSFTDITTSLDCRSTVNSIRPPFSVYRQALFKRSPRLELDALDRRPHRSAVATVSPSVRALYLAGGLDGVVHDRSQFEPLFAQVDFALGNSTHTRTNAMPVSVGSALSSCVKASSPPAEAPTPTIGNGARWLGSLRSSVTSLADGDTGTGLVSGSGFTARSSLLRLVILLIALRAPQRFHGNFPKGGVCRRRD
jgi:hypothetical protein